MAVIQVSKIQVRSGLQQDLPALDTGEFGWSVDTQRLFIGKGTLAEGAPETGVTEILTEYSVGLININIAELNANIANLTPVVGNLVPITTLLLNDQSSVVNIANVTLPSLQSRIINYNITRDTTIRTGTIKVTNSSGTVVYDDDYSESSSTGITLLFTGNVTYGNAVLGYTSTNSGPSGNITYSYTSLS